MATTRAPAQIHPPGGAAPAAGVREDDTGGAGLLQELLSLAARSASGELVCSAPGGEAHVFLQAGRIAWAHDSAHRRAFTEHLRKVAGVGDAEIEAVVAECRRTGHAIGEELVAWKVATAEQVRDALRSQIATALDYALRARGVRSVFLERGRYRTQEASITFPLSELLPAQPPRLAPAAPPVLRPMDRAHAAALAALRDLQELPGFAGAAVLTPAGDPLAILDEGAPGLRRLCALASAAFAAAEEVAPELGAGRGREVHLESRGAQVLLRCHDERIDPAEATTGRAHFHMVLALQEAAALGTARQRIDAVARRLAEHYRA